MVPPQGYAWWYVDAFSADRRFGLTIIAFIGSVFSPYYAWSGRRNPENHCCINVALYGPGARRWAMTERPRRSMARDADFFRVGPSSVHWDGEALIIEIDEIGAPIPRRVKGIVRLTPELIGTTAFALDPQARHRWHPVAPRARVEVDMAHPDLAWGGHGYFDSNFGEEPLEAGFRTWHWSRAHLAREVAVLYEGERRNGEPFGLSLRCDRQGRWREMEAPPPVALPRSGWLVERRTRSEGEAKVRATWEDGPFYARSALTTRLGGETVDAVHESLSLDRFSSFLVQTMLPYRMPRAFV